MIPEKSRPKLAFYALILALLFFGLIHVLFKGHGTYLRIELIGVALLVLLTLISFFNYHQSWGEHLLFFVFLFYIINLILIWAYNSSFYLILFFLSLVGFLMSIPHKHLEQKKEVLSNLPPVEKKLKSEIKSEPHSMIFEETQPAKSETIKPLTKQLAKSTESSSKKTAEKKATTQFSPGKYLASNRSNVYHQAKCEWANNINPKNRVWFQDKEDAWEKGYKSHDCVK